MPADFPAFWYARHTQSYDHGNLPSWTGDANTQSSGAENWDACLHVCSVVRRSPAITSCLRDSAVFTSSTRWQTIPRSTVSFPLSQSTSAHRKARHSLMRSPKQQHSRAIKRKGSFRCCVNAWNSPTVRLRGMRTRFDVPLILTSSIGLRLSLAISPLHAAKSQRFRSTPLMCVLLFGASGRDSNPPTDHD